MKFPLHLSRAIIFLCGGALVAAEPVHVETSPGQTRHVAIATLPPGAFVIEGEVDPALVEGGDLQAVATILLGWGGTGEPSSRSTEDPAIGFEMREGNSIGSWQIWIDGTNETSRKPDPEPAGWYEASPYQRPDQFLQRDGAYPVRITGIPRADGGTLLRFYFLHFDRPVAEHRVNRRLSGAPVHILATLGGNGTEASASRFSLGVREVSAEEANSEPSPLEIVIEALDLSRPEMEPVDSALQKGDRDEAGRRLLRHFQTRSQPRGPSWEEVADVVLHPDYLTIANENLSGRYGNAGWFSQFAAEWTDANGETHSRVLPDGSINWARENGHLNRHFHWVALAKTWEETGDPKYAKHFSREVFDWVTREPFFWENCPQVGGVHCMDGTVFREGYMNTSNIGRRCELTWWPTWEVFRKSPDFTDEAHFAMLLGFLRQSRLLMNPSSFAAHDDGGAHGSMALLQNGLMLPEFRESAAWKAEALRRWDEVLKVQFYPDGGHVSGSTGYNWASLYAIQNFLSLMTRTGAEIPSRFPETLERALRQPIDLSRPDQGQIDLNDGGWSMVDNHYRVVVEKVFPDHPVFTWMATKGAMGTPPAHTSIYLPNSGHIVQRTGWGEEHKYLFLDVGPLGASHGKNDKLNLYLALGSHQLLSSGGRGSYDANPYSAYTGSTYAYNTILVDDLPQQRVHLPLTHTGHVPEERRWVTNARFDFGEGFYRSGWYGSEKNVQGVHTRQVLFLKGEAPPATGYWVVIDTVEPADDEEHEYQALFHSRRDLAEIEESTKAFTCVDRGAGFRILPASVEGLTVRDAIGQTEPYLQGWHVVGPNHAPMHTAEYEWKAAGPTTRAWILEATNLPVNWQVDRWEWEEAEKGFTLTVHRGDGGKDRISRLGIAPGVGIEVKSLDAEGNEAASLEVPPLQP